MKELIIRNDGFCIVTRARDWNVLVDMADRFLKSDPKAMVSMINLDKSEVMEEFNHAPPQLWVEGQD